MALKVLEQNISEVEQEATEEPNEEETEEG